MVIALLGRGALARLGTAVGRARVVRAFGVVTVVTGLVVATGLDLPIQSAVAGALPGGWTATLQAIEEPGDANDMNAGHAPQPGALGTADLPPPIAASLPASVSLDDLGQAPELVGISDWINGGPLTLASLRGKVVLVHFWTFGCINCIHVQPYVKAWYERYADAGLVVVGVHTPELSFERDVANVRDAVAKADVQFPVAVDPDYATWRAYGNHYWPAFYFVDRTGEIRHVHFGEGDYDASEQVVRVLLAGG
jgi:thiol-disulfide isomerase/thioredoxin